LVEEVAKQSAGIQNLMNMEFGFTSILLENTYSGRFSHDPILKFVNRSLHRGWFPVTSKELKLHSPLHPVTLMKSKVSQTYNAFFGVSFRFRTPILDICLKDIIF